jgi:hypothetical protein
MDTTAGKRARAKRLLSRRRAAATIATLAFSTGAHAQSSITWHAETTPYSGVHLRPGRLNLSATEGSEFYAAFIDLCTDGVAMAATAPRTSLERTSSWASNGGLSLAVNGDFYESIGGSWYVYGDAVGNALRWPVTNTGVGIGDWHWAHQAWGWVAFGPGWVDFTHTKYVKQNREAFLAAGYAVDDGWMPTAVAPDPPSGTYNLISGFSALVIAGRVYTCPDPTGGCFPDRGDMGVRNPRTAIGLSSTRQTVILVAVDGRGKRASVGARGEELAWLMGQLGAWHALNLDGGGSTTMWLRGTGIVNAPSDGTERAVFNHVGAFVHGPEAGAVNCPCVPETCNGRDDDCDGVIDEDVCGLDAGAADASGTDAGGADAGFLDGGGTDGGVLDGGVADGGWPDAQGVLDAAVVDAGPSGANLTAAPERGSCDCRTHAGGDGPAPRGTPWALVAMLSLTGARRRSRQVRYAIHPAPARREAHRGSVDKGP